MSGSSDSLPSRITPVCSAPVLLLSSLSDFSPLCKCLCKNEQTVLSCHFCTSSFEKAEPRRFRHIRLPRSCARIDSIFCESPPIPAESQRVVGSIPAVSKQRREHTLDLAVLAQHLHSIKALEIWQKFTRSWVETTTEYYVLCGIIKGISGTIVDKSLEQTHLQHLLKQNSLEGSNIVVINQLVKVRTKVCTVAIKILEKQCSSRPNPAPLWQDHNPLCLQGMKLFT